MRVRSIVLPFVLATSLVGCGQPEPMTPPPAAPDPPGTPVPVARLRSEPFSYTFSSGLTDPQRLVIRDQVAWAAVWAAMWPDGSAQPLPQVDFAREVLVVVALGQRPTGGYGILVDSATATPSGLSVRIRTISPGPRCAVTQSLTQPVDIARLPRSEAAVRFQDQGEVNACE